VCFLSGQRAVVGDRVWWVEAQGTGGKLVGVLERQTVFSRRDLQGRERILAANLGGIVVVCTPSLPEFRAGLLDRYAVAAGSTGLQMVICLNKTDFGESEEVSRALALRESVGTTVLRTSAKTGAGLDALRAFLTAHARERPWAFVGHSGVGKTSIIQALFPGRDVGAIGEMSEYWGSGQHTTTQSCLFELPGGGQLVDSPGIRTFSPGRLEAIEVRRHFWGIGPLGCHYRDCLHRDGEEGCAAPEAVHPELLVSYRRLLQEMLKFDAR
jgi:ribosome biogenesis GTPase / thiamine phosphate phosphatase